MQAIHFDAKTGREIPAHEAGRGASTVGFCSWRRLAEVLRDAGEITANEVAQSFQIDDRGLTFRVSFKSAERGET